MILFYLFFFARHFYLWMGISYAENRRCFTLAEIVLFSEGK